MGGDMKGMKWADYFRAITLLGLSAATVSTSAWAQTGAAPAAQTVSAPVSTVTEADKPLHLDHHYPNYQPEYPDPAQVNGEQGNVVLKVEITSRGKVQNVKVDQSSGFEDLDNSAIAAVLRWRFIPSPYGLEWTKVTIAYRLPTAIIVPPKVPPQAAR